MFGLTSDCCCRIAGATRCCENSATGPCRDAGSHRPAPELQVPLVASPRNQPLWFPHEVRSSNEILAPWSAYYEVVEVRVVLERSTGDRAWRVVHEASEEPEGIGLMHVKTPTLGVLNRLRRFAAHSQSFS